MTKLCKMHCKKKDLKDVMKMVSKPKFICENCFRVANDEEYLHQPIKIKKKNKETDVTAKEE